MKKIIYLILLIIMVGGCKSKTESKPEAAPKPQETGVYNIAQIPGLASLKRQPVQYDSFEQRQTVQGLPDLKSSFTAIQFSFPFVVKESYVKKGDIVKKGDSLFLIESEKMEQTLLQYGKTREPELGALLRASGINPDGRPSRLITIVSPSRGRIIATSEDEALRAASAQNIAFLQVKNDLNIQVTVPAALVGEDTKFYAVIGEKTVPLKIVLSGGEQTSRLNLLLENAEGMPDSERVQIIISKSLSDTFAIVKEAVFNSSGKTYCFVEVSDGLLEQREISGITGDTQFIVTEGLKENQRVINDKIQPILKHFKIQ